MSERPTGVTVIPLDPSGHPEARNDRYALGVNPYTGETYLIHVEGVSYFVSHTDPFRFNDNDFLAKWYTLYDLVANFPLKEGDVCDLSDWVRAFGGRLESNFHLAYEALTTREPLVRVRNKDFDVDVAKQIITAALEDRPEEVRKHLHVHTS